MAASELTIAIQRHQGVPARYALQFVASVGRGMLRISRTGLDVASPAAATGFEDDLELDAIREGHLLWTAGDARTRVKVSFDRLDATELASLDSGIWQPLALVGAPGGWTATLPRARVSPPDASSLDDGAGGDPLELSADFRATLERAGDDLDRATGHFGRVCQDLAELLEDAEAPIPTAAWSLVQAVDRVRVDALERRQQLRQLLAQLPEG